MRGDDLTLQVYSHITLISIHSPRMRGDAARDKQPCICEYFNPLPSHEGRPALAARRCGCSYFNPLPSHEGRPSSPQRRKATQDFNPLPSHEGRRLQRRDVDLFADFNPLPSHEGRLRCLRFLRMRRISIHSPRMRGDPRSAVPSAGCLPISIHSPRMRGDASRCSAAYSTSDFNPLPSHEGRRHVSNAITSLI